MECVIPSCQRPPLDNPEAKGFCILHAPMPDKGLKAFSGALDDEIVRSEDADRVFLLGCYFPRQYECGKLAKALARDLSFFRAVFSGDAQFRSTTFLRKADFPGTTFAQSADFYATIFLGEVGFQDVTFSSETTFLDTTFSREASFRRASFSGFTIFLGANYLEGADFRYVVTSEHVVFEAVSLSKPELVKFHHLDLSRWSFLNTDLQRIDFDDVTWGTYPNLITLLRKRAGLRKWEGRHLPHGLLFRLLRLRMKFTQRRLALYEETHYLEQCNKDTIAGIEHLYRHLKQNYENQRDYSRAGDFYYGEMEMKRLQRNWLGQIPFWIYRFLSGYGERYGQAFTVLMGMILLFGMLFMFAGFIDNGMQVSVHRALVPEPSEWWETLKDFGKSLVYSAESMTLFHQPNITFASFWGKLAELAASVLGILQIALFGLALKRRFKR